MAQRNYPCDNLINAYFGALAKRMIVCFFFGWVFSPLLNCDGLLGSVAQQGDHPDSYFNMTGERIFKQQLYQCMLSQAGPEVFPIHTFRIVLPHLADKRRRKLLQQTVEALILKTDIETRPGSWTAQNLGLR